MKIWLYQVFILLWIMACEEPDFTRLIDPVDQDKPMAGVLPVAGSQQNSVGGEPIGAMIPIGGSLIGGNRGGMSMPDPGNALSGMSSIGGMEAGTVTDVTPLLIGRWESTGSDLAPLLSDPSIGLTRLEATFFSDLRFVVGVDNQDGYHFELEGTYELKNAPNTLLSDEGQIHEITLRQTLPEVTISEGIWKVEGDTLQYEVVQVEPPLPGAQTPPQQTVGFGSTNSGALGTDNLQIYRRLR